MKSGRRRSFSPTVRELVREAQYGRCDNCDEGRCTDFHHKLANTVTNNRLFPLFTQSIFNCVGLCRDCHQGASHFYHIRPDVARSYETWLKLRRIEWSGLKSEA